MYSIEVIIYNAQKNKWKEKNYNLIVSRCHHATEKYFIVCKNVFAAYIWMKRNAKRTEEKKGNEQGKPKTQHKLNKMGLSFNFNEKPLILRTINTRKYND